MNKWGGRKPFVYNRIPTSTCRSNEGVSKSPLGNHHSNSCFRQGSPMDAKTGEQMRERERERETGYSHDLRVTPQRNLLLIQGKIVTLQCRKLADITLA